MRIQFQWRLRRRAKVGIRDNLPPPPKKKLFYGEGLFPQCGDLFAIFIFMWGAFLEYEVSAGVHVQFCIFFFVIVSESNCY